jgi:hypothetical protein
VQRWKGETLTRAHVDLACEAAPRVPSYRLTLLGKAYPFE